MISRRNLSSELGSVNAASADAALGQPHASPVTREGCSSVRKNGSLYVCAISVADERAFSTHCFASADFNHSPATCLVAVLMRFQKFVRAMLRTKTASCDSS
jgi:hypothetical protein